MISLEYLDIASSVTPCSLTFSAKNHTPLVQVCKLGVEFRAIMVHQSYDQMTMGIPGIRVQCKSTLMIVKILCDSKKSNDLWEDWKTDRRAPMLNSSPEFDGPME